MSIVRGFHGTTKECAEKLLENQDHFRQSEGAGDWLGRGIYFWQESPRRAEIWAKRRHKHEAAVIAAQIDCSNFFDLMDLPNFKLLRSAYDSFKLYEGLKEISHQQYELRVSGGKVYTSNNPETDPRFRDIAKNYRDSAYINWFMESLKSRGRLYDGIRGIFLQGRAIYRESFLFDWAHIQICVHNQQVMSDLEIIEI